MQFLLVFILHILIFSLIRQTKKQQISIWWTIFIFFYDEIFTETLFVIYKETFKNHVCVWWNTFFLSFFLINCLHLEKEGKQKKMMREMGNILKRHIFRKRKWNNNFFVHDENSAQVTQFFLWFLYLFLFSCIIIIILIFTSQNISRLTIVIFGGFPESFFFHSIYIKGTENLRAKMWRKLF